MKYTEFKKQYGNSEDLLVDLDDLETYMQGKVKKVRDKRNELIDGVWNVHPVMLTDSQIYIVCPFCGEIHRHGNGSSKYDGGRTAHCDCFGYEIQLIVA